MINAEELLFVVDEVNNPIEPKSRKETHLRNYWHRTSHVWIINKDMEILCQQRSLLKDKNPGFWEPYFGGHLAFNEEYAANAIKELQEELGIQVAIDALHKFDIVKNEKSHEFQCIFFSVTNSKQFILEKEEVSQVKWLRFLELKAVIQESKKKWVLPSYNSSFLPWLATQTNAKTWVSPY